MVQNQSETLEKKKLINNLLKNKKCGINAIIGLSKNAGKTTFLNWLISHSEFIGSAIFSTGRDGEDLDLVGGNEKPKVLIPPSFLYCTFDYEIKKQSPFIEVVEKLNYSIVNKNLWLVKSEIALEAEIIGPPSYQEQENLATKLSTKSNFVFIDGALDRKSIVLSEKIDSIIVVGSANSGDIKEISEEFETLVLLSEIKKKQKFDSSKVISFLKNGKLIESDLKIIFSNEKKILSLIEKIEPDYIYFPGAFTDRNFQKLKIMKNQRIIFDHPLHIFLRKNNLEELISKNEIFSQKEFKIAGFAVNSYSLKGNHLDCSELRNRIRNKFIEIPVVDVTDLGEV